MAAPYDEVVSALAEYFRLGVQNRDWVAWVDLFTDDAVFVDPSMTHHEGREAIAVFIAARSEAFPPLTSSVEWAIVDGDHAAFWMWNHLPDPEGTEYGYDSPRLTVLTYGAGGRWSAAEEFANPEEFRHAVNDWTGAGGSPDMAADVTLVASAPSHPVPPSPSPDRAILEAVCDALVTENWLDLIDTSGAYWHDHGGFGILRWAEQPRVERFRVLEGSTAVIVLESPLRAALVAHVNEQGRVTYLDHVYDAQDVEELSSTS